MTDPKDKNIELSLEIPIRFEVSKPTLTEIPNPEVSKPTLGQPENKE